MRISRTLTKRSDIIYTTIYSKVVYKWAFVEARVVEECLFAAGSVDITPTNPIPLGGYSDRVGPFTQTHSPLEANVLIARCGLNEITFTSVDLLFPGEHLRKNLLTLIPWKETQHLILGATHTHFAPMVQRGMPQLGAVDDAYLKLISTRISDLILRVRNQLQPATIL